MAERNGERSKVDRRKIKKSVEGRGDEKKSFVSTSSIDSTKGDEVQYRDQRGYIEKHLISSVGFIFYWTFFFLVKVGKKKTRESEDKESETMILKGMKEGIEI